MIARGGSSKNIRCHQRYFLEVQESACGTESLIARALALNPNKWCQQAQIGTVMHVSPQNSHLRLVRSR